MGGGLRNGHRVFRFLVETRFEFATTSEELEWWWGAQHYNYSLGLGGVVYSPYTMTVEHPSYNNYNLQLQLQSRTQLLHS